MLLIPWSCSVDEPGSQRLPQPALTGDGSRRSCGCDDVNRRPVHPALRLRRRHDQVYHHHRFRRRPAHRLSSSTRCRIDNTPDIQPAEHEPLGDEQNCCSSIPYRVASRRRHIAAPELYDATSATRASGTDIGAASSRHTCPPRPSSMQLKPTGGTTYLAKKSATRRLSGDSTWSTADGPLWYPTADAGFLPRRRHRRHRSWPGICPLTQTPLARRLIPGWHCGRLVCYHRRRRRSALFLAGRSPSSNLRRPSWGVRLAMISTLEPLVAIMQPALRDSLWVIAIRRHRSGLLACGHSRNGTR